MPLIIDEVQGAFCRCGPMYATQRTKVEPEMIILGKALGGGLPLSATITTPEYSDLLPWEYGFTQAGNPVACAAALAMIEVMERDDLSGELRADGRSAHGAPARDREGLEAHR